MTEASKPAQGALELRKATKGPGGPAIDAHGVPVVGRVTFSGGGFEGGPSNPLYRVPHSASAGPSTSQDAGDAHTDSGRRETNAMRVLRMVHVGASYGRKGRTATEMRDCQVQVGKRSPLTLTEVRRRLTDLQALDYVEKGERKGREFTWKITTAGLLALSVAEGKGRRA